MKTVPFSDILASVCQLVGLDRTTLNDKAFGAVRDFTGRRLSVIWDREEWPDVQRYMYTWPGMPVQSIDAAINTISTETSELIESEDGEETGIDEEKMIELVRKMMTAGVSSKTLEKLSETKGKPRTLSLGRGRGRGTRGGKDK